MPILPGLWSHARSAPIDKIDIDQGLTEEW